MHLVIDEHLHREGFMETARIFEQETGVGINEELKEPLKHLHTILRAMRARDLQPAIQYPFSFPLLAAAIPASDAKVAHRWAERSSDAMSLLFDLRAMEYLHLLKEAGKGQALAYARAQFPHHAQSHMAGSWNCPLFSLFLVTLPLSHFTSPAV